MTLPLTSDRLGLDHLIGTPALKPYMHGYFLSLQLYDTARVIANPFAYADHREKLVKDKIEKMAETRIRTRRDLAGVKVNKALAEKVRKEEESEKKRVERKRAKAAKQEGDKEGKDEMDIDGEGGDEDKESKGKANLLNDPRFKALFQDPEFEVDEETREFALLHPSSVAHRQNGGGANGRGRVQGKTKTAVEEEEGESDKESSDGISHSESESEGSKSEDSDDAGGTIFPKLPPSTINRHLTDDILKFRTMAR